MGNSSWSQQAANFISQKNRTKTTNQIFTQNSAKRISEQLSPFNLKTRESRDSISHPESIAIAIFFDVTGSMGSIPTYMIKESLPTLMDVILQHGTKHPQIMFSSIGDISDEAPVQIGQFESGAEEINTCLSSIWLEGNGHGNREEAYLLSWLIAARHMSIDCFEKRGQKGILFTIGDEASHKQILRERLKEIFGYSEAYDITDKEILQEAQRYFHIYHIHVEQGNYPSFSNPDIIEYWKELLPEHVILMDDYKQLAEIIGTTISLIHGVDLKNILNNFDAETAQSVSKALIAINTTAVTKSNQIEGILEL